MDVMTLNMPWLYWGMEVDIMTSNMPWQYWGLEADIMASNMAWLYSRRVTRTEVRVWWVEIVPMYMVAGTGMAAGLVAYREVHRIVRG